MTKETPIEVLMNPSDLRLIRQALALAIMRFSSRLETIGDHDLDEREKYHMKRAELSDLLNRLDD